jgi:glycosyltransferase involved in cell wall biosynthesis
MSSLVSILIPAYNAEEWIRDTIESALGQTWPNKEIIVVDDGSRDQTLAIVRRFAAKNVCVVTKANEGAAAARNKALSLSQGDYIQWLDADDLIAPDKITKQLGSIENTQNKRTLLSSAWSRFYYRINKARSAENSLWQDLMPIEWTIRKMRDNAWMALETWLMSRELAEATGPWNPSLSADDDGEYVSRLILACERIKFIGDSRSFVRQANLGSLSKNIRSKEKLRSQFRSLALQINHALKLEDSPRMRSACVQYLQRYLIYFYPEQEEIVNDAHKLAHELGGSLQIPELGWKYSPFQRVFGWSFAKKASYFAPKTRAWCNKRWDRLHSQLSSNENTRGAGSTS